MSPRIALQKAPEWNKKIGEAQVGEKNHMYGKQAWNSGKKGISEDTRAKMRAAKLGKTPCNKGLKSG